MNADRGLCGGIHSYVSKQLRPIITVDKEAKLVVYGDKVRSQMQRFAPENIQVVFADVGKRVCAWSVLPVICANDGVVAKVCTMGAHHAAFLLDWVHVDRGITGIAMCINIDSIYARHIAMGKFGLLKHDRHLHHSRQSLATPRVWLRSL